MLHTRWVLVLACLYGSFVACLAYNRQSELSNDGDEYYGDDNVVEEAEKRNLYRDVAGTRSRRDTGEPREYNWDWGQFKLKSEINKRSQIAITSDAKSAVVSGQRKTLIPLEGIVFAKVKNNHLLRPKLSSRLFANSHKFKSRIPIKRRLGTVSRRFDLYPRWFSNSIPSLFGKHFARRYYKPYGSLQSVGGQTRHYINGRHNKRARTRPGTVIHDLPLSWMTGESRDEIPKQNRRESMYDYGGYHVKNFDETKLEGMESDDSLVMNPQSASKGHRSDVGEKKSLPFLKDIPHEIMAQLNPYEYTVIPEHHGVRRSHHFQQRGHLHPRGSQHVIGHLQSSRELDSLPTHEVWNDYHSLPHEHHHRHKLNPCYHNPCLNRGRCHYNQGNFRCQCKQGFSGEICDRTRFSCHPNPCYNGGTCTVLQTGYFCTCLPGFRGHDCDGQNPCASNPCQNSGKCTDTADGYFCTCNKGYTGHTCGDNMHGDDQNGDEDYPPSVPSNNHMIALGQHFLDHELENLNTHDTKHNSGIHSPMHGFTSYGGMQNGGIHGGVSAEDAAAAGIHVNNGWHVPDNMRGDAHGIDASDLPGDHLVGDAPTVHEMGVGHLGGSRTGLDDMQLGGTTTIECPINACMNGGTCVRTATRNICNCLSGNHGPRCEERRGQGIQHGVAGTSGPVGPAVVTPLSIHSPIQHVNNAPYNDCTLNCRNGGKCMRSSSGNYHCDCPTTHSGEFCETMLPHEGHEGIHNEGIHNEGIHNEGMHNIGIHNEGIHNEGIHNEGILNEAMHNDGMHNEGMHNLGMHNEGMHNEGMHIEGMHNEGIHNEGIHNEGLHSDLSHFTCALSSCKNGGTCLSHVCACPVGFQGADCGSADLCTPNPCENGGSCGQEGEETYKCTCLSGFKGLDCNLANHCTKDACKNNGVCEETADAFHCKCNVGFKGERCSHTSPCLVNPCVNKGVCVDNGLDFLCTCEPGFAGTTCDMKDACYPNPCINSGLCTNELGLAICNCSHGWSGHFCDSADICTSLPCLNGGLCEHMGETHKCTCTPGFQGSQCELIDQCYTDPCENQGRCEHAGTNFLCKCPSGYHGERCHMKAHCQPSPCNAHGECFESDEGFICECNPRYMGKFCDVTRNCFDNPCSNGGHCVETESNFVCHCPFGYRGKSCSVNVCDSHPCLNGGTCIPAENDVGYGCECVFPYHGVTCGEMDPCLTNPCRNGGTCQSQLQGGLLTGLSHMSVFGPYECGPYDTDGHCGAQAHHHDSYDGHHEEAKIGAYPSYEAKGLEAKPDSYKTAYGNGALDNDKDMGRFDHEKDKDMTVFDKDKDMGHFDKDKDMGQLGKDVTTDITKDKDSHFDKGKGSFDASKDSANNNRYQDNEASSSKAPSSQNYYADKDRPRGDSSKGLGGSDIEKDGRISSFSSSGKDGPGTGKGSRFDEGKDQYGGDSGKDSGKDSWPIEAKNDHAGLLDKVDYYPKHQPESAGASKISSDQLPDCPCNPQPCMWPPACTPQACTPPCKRHFDDNEQRQFADTYHKRTIKLAHNKTVDVHATRRTLPRASIKNIYAKTLNTPDEHNKTVVKRSTKYSKKNRNDVTKLTIKDILALKRDVIIDVKASKRLEIIPKVIINYRHPGQTNVYKRTMHELYVCQCPLGYLGAHCQHMNPCRASPCTNGGSCIPRGDRYICQCLPGYGGRHCDDPHPCTPNPCTHGGRCHLAKSVRGYECRCKGGWRGYNCEDRDNCAMSNPCRHDGNCINVDGAEGGIECKCRTRYSGKHCEIDTCAACDMNAYCHHGNCVCEAGYFGNGFRCKAMTDICTPNPCDNKGECKPGLDGKLFSCECQSGYVGTRCELPHPCANNPCLHNGACVDESNSKDRGILLLDRNDYKCFCSAGYKGKNCGETSLAACSSGPCQHNGTCFDSSSESHSKHLIHSEDYECFCAMAFTGKNCEINHFACYSYPCMNGGTCLDSESLPDINFDAHGYKCNCNHGFIGRNCEVTIYGPGACHQSPCLNNGRCLDAMNSNDPDIHFDYEHQFKCICPAQYSGKLCEVPYPACFSNPCHNKGICSDRSKEPTGVFDEYTGYTCTCLAGYDGRNCERQNSLAITEDIDADHPHDFIALEGKPDGKVDEDIHEDVKPMEGKKDDGELGPPKKVVYIGTSGSKSPPVEADLSHAHAAAGDSQSSHPVAEKPHISEDLVLIAQNNEPVIAKSESHLPIYPAVTNKATVSAAVLQSNNDNNHVTTEHAPTDAPTPVHDDIPNHKVEEKKNDHKVEEKNNDDVSHFPTNASPTVASNKYMSLLGMPDLSRTKDESNEVRALVSDATESPKKKARRLKYNPKVFETQHRVVIKPIRHKPTPAAPTYPRNAVDKVQLDAQKKKTPAVATKDSPSGKRSTSNSSAVGSTRSTSPVPTYEDTKTSSTASKKWSDISMKEIYDDIDDLVNGESHELHEKETEGQAENNQTSTNSSDTKKSGSTVLNIRLPSAKDKNSPRSSEQLTFGDTERPEVRFIPTRPPISETMIRDMYLNIRTKERKMREKMARGMRMHNTSAMKLFEKNPYGSNALHVEPFTNGNAVKYDAVKKGDSPKESESLHIIANETGNNTSSVDENETVFLSEQSKVLIE